MNTYIKGISLTAIVLCTFNADAYKYTLVNFTKQKHKVEMILEFVGETWQDLGTVNPLQEVSYDFGGLRVGMCLRGISIDGKERPIVISTYYYNKLIVDKAALKAMSQKSEDYLDSQEMLEQFEEWVPHADRADLIERCKLDKFYLIELPESGNLVILVPYSGHVRP